MAGHSFDAHNHSGCIDRGLNAARDKCTDQGLKLTPVRARVLEILLGQHRAFGAYDILDQLRDEGLGSQPPVVYRALDFLVQHGFAHRIERLNAFVACAHPGEDHAPAFLICRSCTKVAETEATQSLLNATAGGSGFAIEQAAIEAEGLCPNCQDGAA